jgi:ABC-type multidrug transport system fused ATPase/permease subunit
MTQISGIFIMLQSAVASAERVFELLEAEEASVVHGSFIDSQNLAVLSCLSCLVRYKDDNIMMSDINFNTKSGIDRNCRPTVGARQT